MRILTTVVCLLAAALAGGAAFAADVSGKWTGQVQGQDGPMTLTFQLKQDGSKLTGTTEAAGMPPMEIKDGKVEGDKISFVVTFDGGGGEMKIIHEGTLKGDELAMKAKFEGADIPEMTFTMKKAS